MKRISVLLLGLIATSAFAQVKISELPPATTPLDGTELVPLVQGSTVQATVDDVSDAAIAELTSADVRGKWTGTCNASTYLNGNGVCTTPAGTGATYTTGTFTASWETACTTTPTQNWKYVVVGTLVTLIALQDVSCTSDSSTFTASGALPVGIRPDIGYNILGLRTVDNGAVDTASGCLRVETDGSLTYFRSASSPCAANSYTTSGTKSVTFGSGSNQSPRVWTYDMDALP